MARNKNHRFSVAVAAAVIGIQALCAAPAAFGETFDKWDLRVFTGTRLFTMPSYTTINESAFGLTKVTDSNADGWYDHGARWMLYYTWFFSDNITQLSPDEQRCHFYNFDGFDYNWSDYSYDKYGTRGGWGDACVNGFGHAWYSTNVPVDPNKNVAFFTNDMEYSEWEGKVYGRVSHEKFYAAITDNDDLVAQSQSLGTAGTYPNVYDITERWLLPEGKTTPDWDYDTPLIGYATPWNGWNIAGLTYDGQIEAVWTAPDQEGRWYSTNLSEAYGTPPLARGSAIAAYVNWGINLTGVLPNGDLGITWWSTELEAERRAAKRDDYWAFTDITATYGGPKLEPASIAAWTDPYRPSANVAGLTAEDGHLVVYQWFPDNAEKHGKEWIVTDLTAMFPDNAPLRGKLTVTASWNKKAANDGWSHIFGLDEEGWIWWYWWNNDDGEWHSYKIQQLREDYGRVKDAIDARMFNKAESRCLAYDYDTSNPPPWGPYELTGWLTDIAWTVFDEVDALPTEADLNARIDGLLDDMAAAHDDVYWSRACITPPRTVPPSPYNLDAPANLRLVDRKPATPTVWEGLAVRVQWDAVPGADTYKVEYLSGTAVVHTVSGITDTQSSFSRDQMDPFLGGPWRALNVKVQALNAQGASLWSPVFSVSNPQIGAPQGLSASSSYSFTLWRMDLPTNNDYAGTRVWVWDPDNTGVQPGGAIPSNLVYDGVDVGISIAALHDGTPLQQGASYDYLLGHYDTFGKDGMNLTPIMTETMQYLPGGGADDVNPDVPVWATVSSKQTVLVNDLITLMSVRFIWLSSYDDVQMSHYVLEWWDEADPDRVYSLTQQHDPDDLIPPAQEYSTSMYGLPPNTTLSARVAAIDWAGNQSNWSTVLTVNVGDNVEAPGPITNLQAIPGLNKVVISWVNPTDDFWLTSKVYRSVNNCNSFLDLISESRGNTVVDSDVSTDGTQYCYMVTTHSSSGKQGPAVISSLTKPFKIDDIKELGRANARNID